MSPPVALAIHFRLRGFVLTLIERFESMGRKGGVPALATALILLIICAASAYTGWSNSFGDSRWMVLGPNAIAIMAFGLSGVFAIVGAKLLTRTSYAMPEDLFPSMHRDDFLRALREEPRPVFACTRCRIHIPAQFSTGSCPRCASSVDYLEIGDDKDAEIAASAVS